MGENLEFPEGLPIPSKEEVVAKLLAEGLTSGNMNLVEKWLEDRRFKERSGVESAYTNIELSSFYVAVQDYDEAEQCLSEAMYQFQQEGDEEGYNIAQEKLRKLDEIREGR